MSNNKSTAGKPGRAVEFQWTIRGVYHNLFWMLFIILIVLLVLLMYIGQEIGSEEMFTQLLNPWNLGLTGACLLCCLLDIFYAPAKIISFQHNTLFYYRKGKRMWQIPVRRIKQLGINRIGRNHYALFIRTSEKDIKIKLTWAWVWDQWKLEKRIERLRKVYGIHAYL